MMPCRRPHPFAIFSGTISGANGEPVNASALGYSDRHIFTRGRPVELPIGQMLTSEMNITTAVGYPDEFPELIVAMPRLQEKIASLISHRVPFEQLLEGLEIAAPRNRPRS